MSPVTAYLARLDHHGGTDVSLDTLFSLQLAHMTHVPFENLDVVAGTPVRTTADWSIPKVVDRTRGGWCFEVNSAFGTLLEALGFRVSYHSARVFDAMNGGVGPALDHLCLEVALDGTRWLVDVGFGDSSVLPVLLEHSEEQDRRPRRCRVEQRPDGWAYVEWMYWDDWELQYLIDPEPTPLEAFQARSDELAAGAGDGFFTEKPFATRALNEHGDRVWLLKDRLDLRRGDGHQERSSTPVGPGDWSQVLWDWFGMEAPEPVLRRVRELDGQG